MPPCRITLKLVLIAAWVVLAVPCVVFSQPGMARYENRDSIRNLVLNYPEPDTQYIIRLSQLASSFYPNQPDSIIYFGQLALKESIKLDYSKGMIRSYGTIHNGFSLMGNADSSLYYAELAFEMAKKVNDTKLIIKARFGCGWAYNLLNDFERALECYLEALDYAQAADYTGLVIGCYNNIGGLFENMGRLEQALENYEAALVLSDSVGEPRQVSGIMNNIGSIYRQMHQYDRALSYFERALKIAVEIENFNLLAHLNNNLGIVETHRKNYPEALKYYQQALLYSKRQKNARGVTDCYCELGKVHLLMGNLEESERFLLKCIREAEASHVLHTLSKGLKRLSELDSASGDFQSALGHYKQFITIRDSLLNAENIRQVEELHTRFQTARKEKENEQLKHERDLQQAVIQRQKIFVWAVVAGLVLTVLFIIVLSRLFLQLRRAFRTVELQKDHLKDRNTQLVLLNEMIANQKAQLEELNQMKNKLFSIISHDLKGPLNSIGSMVELISEDEVTPQELKELSPVLKDHVTQTRMLLDNLLGWSFSQMHEIKLRPVKVDMDQLFNEAIRLFGPKAVKKSIDIVNELSRPVFALADGDIMRLVLRNLISNAIKFTPSGGQVFLSAESVDGNRVKVVIRDTGSGIPEELLNRILETSGSPVTGVGTAGERGTGLGLRVCREFVNRSGGEFSIESRPEYGTVVSFTISAI